MYSLSTFKMTQMIDAGQALRVIGDGAASMEGVAQRIVRFLHDNLRGSETEERECVLVRFYKTHTFCELEPDLQEFAVGILDDGSLRPEMKCLTLLASVGENERWGDRRNSAGHKAIPLPSELFVDNFPMISQLIKQFGFDVDAVVSPDPRFLLDVEQKTYNVFYVPEALGSPYVPAQENFVIPYSVKSALGFGGMLPTGDLFAVILFTRVPVSQETAELFKTLSLNVKLAILPFARGPVFV